MARFIHGFQGYGREFEKALTRKPTTVNGNVTHNRAINYTLGGLKLIFRFEVDGYTETIPSTSTEETPATPSTVMQGTYTGPSCAHESG